MFGSGIYTRLIAQELNWTSQLQFDTSNKEKQLQLIRTYTSGYCMYFCFTYLQINLNGVVWILFSLCL